MPASHCQSHSDCPPTYVCLEEKGFCVRGDAGIALQPGVSGVERDVVLTPGQSLVLRAIAHSDGVGLPFVALLRPADRGEISSTVGSTTSTRDAPDVLVLTAEVPEGSATVRVVLGNAAGGTVYWHQVELLPNLMRNPSFERYHGVVLESGASIRPPEDWRYDPQEEIRREGDKVHSGSSSVRLVGNFLGFTEVSQSMTSAEDGVFYAVGGFFWNFLGDIPRIQLHGGSLFLQHKRPLRDTRVRAQAGPELGRWHHPKAVGRRLRTTDDDIRGYDDIVCWGGDYNDNVDFAVDDAYVYALTPLAIEPRAADRQASTSDGLLRIDGDDRATQQADFLGTDQGSVAATLRVGTPLDGTVQSCAGSAVLLDLRSADDNRIVIGGGAEGRLAAIVGVGAQAQSGSSAAGVLTPGVPLDVAFTYSPLLEVFVDGARIALDSPSPLATHFVEAPGRLAIGSTHEGDDHCSVAVALPGARLIRGTLAALDAGSDPDAGVPLDAGGHPPDAGAPGDAGAPEDRGARADVGGGPPDAGPAEDDGACSATALVCAPPLAFEAAMRKEGAPDSTEAYGGPFDYGIRFQGDPASAAAARGDVVLFGRAPLLIGQTFYRHVDTGQGTVLAWVTPAWSAADLPTGALVALWRVAGIEVSVRGPDGAVVVRIGEQEQSFVPTTSFVAGEPRLVVLRWDSRRTLDGTYQVLVTIDRETRGLGPFTFDLDEVEALGVIGASDAGGSASANAMIEGFTVYRRPLFDGQRGVYMGNGDELGSLLLEGHGRDVVWVTGAWDVVFALPAVQLPGRLDTAGQAWCQPHAENLIGAEGFFVEVGDGEARGWRASGGAQLAPLEVEETIFGAGVAVTSPTP